jgi:hypothetical protein
MCKWTAEPMAVQRPRKGESSNDSMRYGFRTQPAHLVRGSSRRIMTMRFRPANIRVINRRVCSSAAIGPAVQNRGYGKHEWRERISPRLHRPNQAEGQGERNLRFLSPLESPFFPKRSELTSRIVIPPSRPSKAWSMPERCSPSRVRFAAPNCGAPLTAPLRSGQTLIATGGSGGITQLHAEPKKQKADFPPVGRKAGRNQNTIKPGGA